MNSSRKLRRLIPATAVALFAVALVAPTAKAAEIPPLVTTSQYKALVGFVEKLETLSGTPATTAKKASYEDQLENKHDATVDKSTALFNRGKKAALLESERAIQTGVQTIRQTEAGELTALRRDYDARMDRAATNYARAVGHVEDVYDNRNAALAKQVSRLRKQKADAESAARKSAIQGAIDRRTERTGENRRLKQEELVDLKAGYGREKAAIRSAKQSTTKSVQQNDAEAIVTLRNRGKRIYNSTVRTLQSRRVDQLHDLEAKVNRGRAAITRMPAKT
ncbi:MAG TPA: hypothetical protein VN522_04980 [Solirubrobacterales bacterium]|nr:hypothetical protein [Solirubrobacterales bacterium]